MCPEARAAFSLGKGVSGPRWVCALYACTPECSTLRGAYRVNGFPVLLPCLERLLLQDGALNGEAPKKKKRTGLVELESSLLQRKTFTFAAA